jgi:tetratricopeptide (TPR) repeat protein
MAKIEDDSTEDGRLAALMEECTAAADAGDIARAEALTVQVMAAVMAKADKEPSPWLALVTQAAAHEDRHEWQEAERCYREALAVSTEQGAEMEFKAHSDLAEFLSLMDRNEEALAEARLSEAAARQSMSIVRRRGLLSLASRERECGNRERARELIDEVVAMEDLQEDRMGRASVLVTRARCHVDEGDTAAAQADLSAAWVILEPYQERSLMAGHHSSLSAWWSVSAQLFGKQGNVAEECAAASRSLEHARIVADAGQLKRSIRLSAMVRALRRYTKALAGAGSSAELDAANDELSDLLVMLYGPAKAPAGAGSGGS